MGCKKQGAKNRVIVIQKENRQSLLFSGRYFGPDFFKVPDPKKYQVDLIN